MFPFRDRQELNDQVVGQQVELSPALCYAVAGMLAVERAGRGSALVARLAAMGCSVALGARGWTVDRAERPVTPEAHRCVPPADADGHRWTGRRDTDGSPLWACPTCRRWWGFGWPGFGGHLEEMAWMPMREFFTGHEPETFKDLIDAERPLDDS